MVKDSTVLALIARREANDISPERAAEMAGVSIRTYQRFEAGESSLRLNQYHSLLRNMGVSELDVCLDKLGIDTATPWEVAAAARVLPEQARKALVTMIMSFYRSHILRKP